MQKRFSWPKSGCCIGVLIFAASFAQAESVWLSSLDLTRMTCGWSAPKANAGIMGTPISIAGKQFARGIGTHAESKLRLDIGGKATRFFAQVGVDDSAGAQGSVEFIVSGDGKLLWRSGLMTGGSAALPVDVNISGVRVLALRVTDGGDGGGSAHADWADAGIEMQPGAATPTPLAAYETFELKTRSFALEFQVGDDNRVYQHALGMTRANGTRQRFEEAYPPWGDGYIWDPALQATHANGNTSTTLLFDSTSRTNEASDRELLRIRLRDPAYPFEVTLCFRAHRDRDLLEQWTEIRHSESGAVRLERMASSALLLNTNLHLTHFFGDWGKEMQPVSERLTAGTKVLDSKLGVRANQFRNPSFILSFDGPPTENNGHVLAGSLAWSGNFQFAFDHNGGAIRALSGVNPFASAYALTAGETFTTPPMIWVWSEHGLGEMSRKFHHWARNFGVRDGHNPRRVLVNNWYTTGFDFDQKRIANLFEPASQIGADLFLLDDGWFGNKYPRINDRAGLGDWQPNRKRFPDGLASVAAEATKRNLSFGIWIEPEMVNPQSELFEQHPNWVVAQPKRELEFQRNQLVLDLTRPEVKRFEWQVISNTLSVPGIAFAKWDCNRFITQPGSSLPPEHQSHLFIDYVRALYALMNSTVKAFPKTELMLCAGGGGRVDYGALRYFHEFWPSDNTDPLARVQMQWDYSYFFPAISITSHVTRQEDRPLHFACCVSMSGCFGLDLDLAKLSPEDKAICSSAVSAYQHVRDVIHLGDLYRLESPHDSARCALNFVNADRSHAVMFVFQMKDGQALPVAPQGLNPVNRYIVRQLNPAPARPALLQEAKSFTGEELMHGGIVPNCARAMEACVITLSP